MLPLSWAKYKKTVVATLCASMLVACVSQVWFIGKPINTKAEITFILKPGASAKQIAHTLPVRPTILTELYLRLLAHAFTIKHGEYMIAKKASLFHVLTMIVQGRVYQRNVTILPGMTAAQIIATLNHARGMSPTTELLMTHALKANSPCAVTALEGAFFPDTYRYEYPAKASDILMRAHGRLCATLYQQWQKS